ncbi:DUF2489 domain-containing protein [Wenzhouxiangella sp. AB-CW3]|uniref:DUF2489 domain-containing protein n=1 Tax=Wenzhouxiangella sp. AB-CW3 TaxID=2771012 RepID=UPI00168AC998|nr:DUF2489 domain-containing protein [Wenzhouxiangella sp. AB-CW3]QOC23685.1 DUF2489 domain-containing protein [Wenzhouxiangella sp. AB-CW3]
MTTTLWILLALGLLIILALAAYAGFLWWQVYDRGRKQRREVDAHNGKLFESIKLISMAMQQEQCELSEGSIRLTVLLDHLVLPDNPDFSKRYPAIHDMHERIKHMPTHDARKAFPPQIIEQMDEEREGYEVEMEDDIQADVRHLLNWVREAQKT